MDNFFINKVVISGKATKPVLKTLSNGSPLCYFSLSCGERWIDKNGNRRQRNNWFKIEALGQMALQMHEKVKENCTYLIDGFIRQEKFDEDKSIVKIRVYSIKPLQVTEEVMDELSIESDQGGDQTTVE